MGKQRNRQPSIWGAQGPDGFAQLVALLQAINETPSADKSNDLQEFASRHAHLQGNRSLTFEEENDLVKNLAFVTAITDDPNRVTALYVGENKHSTSLTVTLAVNHGDLRIVEDGLKRIVKIMMDVAKGGAETAPSPDTTEQLLREVISLNRGRIYSRLRSKHAPKSRRTKGKTPIMPRLGGGISRAKPAMAPASVSKQELESIQFHVKELATITAKLEAQPEQVSKSERATDLQISLVKSAYRLSKQQNLAPLLQCSPGLDPREQTAFLKAVAKLGRYYTVTKSLLTTAQTHAPLKNILIKTLPQPPIPTPPSSPQTEIQPQPPSISTIIDRLFPTLPPAQKQTYKLTASTFARKTSSAETNPDALLRNALSSAPCVHAEIQLFYNHLLNPPPDTRPPRVIVASKKACYLCDMFLRLDGRFFTPRTHGRCYGKWTLVERLENGNVIPRAVARTVAGVVEGMREVLVGDVEKVLRDGRRPVVDYPDESATPSVVGGSGAASVVTLRGSGSVETIRVEGVGSGAGVGDVSEGGTGNTLVRTDTQKSTNTTTTAYVPTDGESDRRASSSSQSTIGSPQSPSFKERVRIFDDKQKEAQAPVADSKPVTTKGIRSLGESKAVDDPSSLALEAGKGGGVEEGDEDGAGFGSDKEANLTLTPIIIRQGCAVGGNMEKDSGDTVEAHTGLDSESEGRPRASSQVIVQSSPPLVEPIGEDGKQPSSHVIGDRSEVVTQTESSQSHVDTAADSIDPPASYSHRPSSATTQPIPFTDAASALTSEEEEQLRPPSSLSPPSTEIGTTERTPTRPITHRQPTTLLLTSELGPSATPIQIISAMANPNRPTNPSAIWNFNNSITTQRSTSTAQPSRRSNLHNASRTSSSQSASNTQQPSLQIPQRPPPLQMPIAPQNPFTSSKSLSSVNPTTESSSHSASQLSSQRLAQPQPQPPSTSRSGSTTSRSTSQPSTTHQQQLPKRSPPLQPQQPSQMPRMPTQPSTQFSRRGSVSSISPSESASHSGSSHAPSQRGGQQTPPQTPQPAGGMQLPISQRSHRTQPSHQPNQTIPTTQDPVVPPIPLVPQTLKKGESILRALSPLNPRIKIYAAKLHLTLEADPPTNPDLAGQVCWAQVRWLGKGEEGPGKVHRVKDLKAGSEGEKVVDWKGHVLERRGERFGVGFFWKEGGQLGQGEGEPRVGEPRVSWGL